MNLANAYLLASGLFVNIIDKSGEPYFSHCISVMRNLHTNDEELKIIAILHDVVEDTRTTFEDLTKLGYSDRVVNALRLLTHDKDTSYEDYVRNIAESGNEDARLVKLADLKDNCNVTRLKGLTSKDHRRISKYHWAITYLSKV